MTFPKNPQKYSLPLLPFHSNFACIFLKALIAFYVSCVYYTPCLIQYSLLGYNLLAHLSDPYPLPGPAT